MVSINKWLKILTVVLIIGMAVSAQRPEPKLWDQFGNIPCEELRGRLDLFMNEVASHHDSQGVIVGYDGQFTRYGGERPYKLLPKFGELQLMMTTFRNHFIFRRFDTRRIVFLSGGYRDDYGLEFWLVAPGGAFPDVRPTLKSIKYGKGTPQPVNDCP
ncbi:MAG: hypothetical protein ABIR33_13865 [Pyrinomonadaceae bacterium]